MTIYAIFEVHENEGWDESDVDVLVGYVESVEAANRLCDTTKQQQIHDEQEAKYDAWREKEQKWIAENKHKFVNVDQINSYVTRHQALAQRIHNFNCSPPNLSKVPEDRRDRVMAGFINKRAPLERELADLAAKIGNCLNIEAAKSINDALLKDKENVLGERPPYPDFVYKRHYEAIEKLD
jgi:hypothetical protein